LKREAAPVAHLFAGYEVDEEQQPVARLYDYDVEARLDSVLALESRIPPDAISARTLNTERVGNAVVISESGLLVTIGYLITEAEEVMVTTNDGRRIEAHPLGIDQATGFGVMQALEPLDLPAIPFGDSRKLKSEMALISAGAGGREHALSSHLLARQPFAGSWEYYLEAALYVAPGHPHWNGAALLGPDGSLVGIGSLHMQQQSERGEVSTLNMFVPAELLPPILDDLAHGRRARPPRPWLGVMTAVVDGRVVIDSVSPGGPAARAELRHGDVIHKIAGERVRDQAELYQRLWALGQAGVVAPLTIQRERDVFDMEVRTADRTAMQKRRTLN
jgi:S1-C subfamily serine protease